MGASASAQTLQQYMREGHEELKSGRLDRAITAYSRAISINPNIAKAYDNRGIAYAQEGSWTRAIDDFTMAIAINWKDAEAFNNRGLAYAHQGDWAKAILDYTRAIKINAFYIKAYNNREQANFSLKHYDKVWSDVHTVQAIGGKTDPDFIQQLQSVTAQGSSNPA